MISDIVYTSNVILNKTGPFVTGSGSSISIPPIFFKLGSTNAFVTGSGTTYLINDFFFILGPTNPFVTGSDTFVEYKDMTSQDFDLGVRTNIFETGSNVTLDLSDLQYEQLEPYIVGTTKIPTGKPYREIIIIS